MPNITGKFQSFKNGRLTANAIGHSYTYDSNESMKQTDIQDSPSVFNNLKFKSTNSKTSKDITESGGSL